MLLWTQTGENSLSTLQKAQNFAGSGWSALTRNVFSKTYLQSLMEIIKIATMMILILLKDGFKIRLVLTYQTFIQN